MVDLFLWPSIFLYQEDFQLGSGANYLYELATGSIYRFYSPVDDEEFVPYLEDLATGTIYQKPEGLKLQDDPRVDGEFWGSTTMMDCNHEIVLWDKKHKHNGRITANDIEDSQPVIGGYILTWKGDRGDDAEIYTYEIPHITLVSPDAGIEFHRKEEFPVFVWNSKGYIKFKIQFSTVASFEEQHTLTLPNSVDFWLNESFITLDKESIRDLNEMLDDFNEDSYSYLYWRVLAQDNSRNEEISQARHIVVYK